MFYELIFTSIPLTIYEHVPVILHCASTVLRIRYFHFLFVQKMERSTEVLCRSKSRICHVEEQNMRFQKDSLQIFNLNMSEAIDQFQSTSL